MYHSFLLDFKSLNLVLILPLEHFLLLLEGSSELRSVLDLNSAEEHLGVDVFNFLHKSTLFPSFLDKRI